MATVGDIDILTTAKLDSIRTRLASDPKFVGMLMNGDQRLSFLYKLETKTRQVDILYLPLNNFYFGLLYFTGSKTFNEHMRAHAKQMGLTLNQYGLFKGKRALRAHSEEDIFALLGLTYVMPELRN